MNRLANEAANLVPIAVPPTWRKSLLLNLKLFVVRTVRNSCNREELVGLS